jgi:hypothetical protein
MRNTNLVGLIAAGCALLATACSSTPAKPEAPVQPGDSGLDRAFSRTGEGLTDAALSPLNDLNLRRTPIPPLLEALSSPYEAVSPKTCETIARQVTALTFILGPDSDAEAPPEDRLDQKAGDTAADAALGEVASTLSGFIPYRSLVRQATGASAHEKKLRAAYETGMRRRAYLKGLGAMLECEPPAAPISRNVISRREPTIEYRRAQGAD